MNTVHELLVPQDHPSLAGHFPGNPVVPGVVLLDFVLAALPRTFVLKSIPVAKFLQPVLPGERIELQVQITDTKAEQIRVNFQGSRATTLVFEGSFMLSSTSAKP